MRNELLAVVAFLALATPLVYATYPLGYVDGVIEFAKISYPGGLQISLDADDILWTARMLEGEGAHTQDEAQAVIWTLIQRRWWGTGMARPNPQAFAGYRTWRAYIRTFSQPINPKWAEDGEFCRPGGRYHTTQWCSPDKLLRRRIVSSLEWDDVGSLKQQVALLFASGRLPNNAPGVISFRARDGVDASPLVPVAPDELPFTTRNQFYYSAGKTSKEWGGEGISLIPTKDPVTTIFSSLIPGGRNLVARLTGR